MILSSEQTNSYKKNGAIVIKDIFKPWINLLIHSLSIITVFKINVLIRSILFFLVYMFLIYQNITIIMLTPVLLVIILIASVLIISKRENLEEMNNSLLNISNIDNLK